MKNALIEKLNSAIENQRFENLYVNGNENIRFEIEQNYHRKTYTVELVCFGTSTSVSIQYDGDTIYNFNKTDDVQDVANSAETLLKSELVKYQSTIENVLKTLDI